MSKTLHSTHSLVWSVKDHIIACENDDFVPRLEALQNLQRECAIVVISNLAQKQKLEEFIRNEIWPDYSDRDKFRISGR